MAKNDELLHQEARSLASQSRIKYFDLVIAQGNGALLTDADGKEYIDLLASASSTNTGHCHPSVVQAITQQAQKLIQYTPAYFANQIAAQLSTRLTKLAPMSGPVKLAWGNSGSDANDAIIKFARAYTGRQYIVTFTGAYHGSTYGSLTASGVSLNMTRKLGPLLPGIIKVPYPDPWQKASQETEEQFVERMFAAFKLPFETYLPPDEVACILIEPIQGDGGIIKAPTKYLQKVYEFAHEHGILFAVDEVNQGMGRTGKWWSIQHFELEPDLMSVGKSLASGLPLSAVIGRAEIMEALDAPAHIFTTAGNPLTAAAALATIEIIEKEELLRRSTELGRSAATFFQQAQAKYDFIGDVRMYGLNGGIDIVDPKTKQPSTEIATKIIHRAFKLGVIMISLRGNILRFQPPLVITTAQLEQAFAILEQVFSEEAAGKLQLPKNAAELGW
ncbi:aspartate aminotransferase family protein [Ligilactobacillus animalis]|uniref:4-aminobutyrate transaminase, gabT n=1 Tax=Ligilactobacillus animalis TaxID=1605 RepID=A0ABR4RR66_9LACO|nr:aspartate aminotransferase family protein [Ligilactobacillus animalis]KDA46275.1 4-aminobutyrate transaminase, gabT [Ligilactobacillus animalis]MEE0261376.1 aspartate aminotransferase family protein [Ligilactobacillus animalis]PNQ52216.1 aspartate aminotransferase family protein [Ligilactobacillus animalis]